MMCCLGIPIYFECSGNFRISRFAARADIASEYSGAVAVSGLDAHAGDESVGGGGGDDGTYGGGSQVGGHDGDDDGDADNDDDDGDDDDGDDGTAAALSALATRWRPRVHRFLSAGCERARRLMHGPKAQAVARCHAQGGLVRCSCVPMMRTRQTEMGKEVGERKREHRQTDRQIDRGAEGSGDRGVRGGMRELERDKEKDREHLHKHMLLHR
eukprot:6212310-Pleurochrysis_carterae.AAC.4